MSLSGKPGNFGTRFHNFLYHELELDFLYKAFTTRDLRSAMGGIRALEIRGCAVSMPFKEACLEFVDELDASASAIQSLNTVVNDDGRLKAYNTDYLAVRSLLAGHALSLSSPFVVRGSGGMAKAVAHALHDAGFGAGHVFSRNALAGAALARACNFEWLADLGSLQPALLINATPIGMLGGPDAERLAFPLSVVEGASTVFDVVARPAETPLIRAARAAGKAVITGAEVIVLQAVEQFVLYTGVRPNASQVERAARYAFDE